MVVLWIYAAHTFRLDNVRGDGWLAVGGAATTASSPVVLFTLFELREGGDAYDCLSAVD